MANQIASPKDRLSARDRVVVLMGPTGAGKSTFINHATRQGGQGIGHSLKSQTSEIRAVRCKHPVDQSSVVFVDTPGFDDTHRSDIEILSQIAGWFVKLCKEHVPLAAIVYLHRISDNRMAGSPLKNLQMFASMCGQQAMPSVVLGTTMWNEVNKGTGERREAELKTNFWKDMIEQDCRVERFHDSYESAWEMIGKLPPASEGVILSTEIVHDKKNLNETAAGVKLNEELAKLIADQKAAIKRMAEQAQTADDPVLVEELQKIEGKIQNVAVQLGQLKVPFGRKLMNFFAGRKARKSGIRIP